MSECERERVKKEGEGERKKSSQKQGVGCDMAEGAAEAGEGQETGRGGEYESTR